MRSDRSGAIDYDDLTLALYEGILGRAPDRNALSEMRRFLRGGGPLSQAISSLITSMEFQGKSLARAVPGSPLPDLRTESPDNYLIERTDYQEDVLVFRAAQDRDFDRLEAFIGSYRYYDALGVWGSGIDLDKRVTAGLAIGLGARRCLELGCYSGPVLKVLKGRSVQVVGVDASHLAFMLAYPEVKRDMIFGDLLGIDLGAQQFDVILAMDLLEHLNPLKMDRYIERLRSLLKEDGYIYLNSPMFGEDDIFGTVFPQYLKEWQAVGDKSFWRDLDCDALGWPKHGHLVWASPSWWEAKFAAHDLHRDRTIERAIHQQLNRFFELAPGRKTLFVLKSGQNKLDPAAVVKRIRGELAKIEELPRAL